MTYLLATAVVLFPAGMLLKKVFPGLCAICFAMAAAWLAGAGYLAVYGSTGAPVDPLSVAILMGGSAVGSMYYLSRRVRASWRVFKLPYIVTLFAAVYAVLTRHLAVGGVLWVAGLWVFFFVVYVFRCTRTRAWFQKIIACCKDW